jgi:hypothetical protein
MEYDAKKMLDVEELSTFDSTCFPQCKQSGFMHFEDFIFFLGVNSNWCWSTLKNGDILSMFE